jgi:hypothetical protein
VVQDQSDLDHHHDLDHQPDLDQHDRTISARSIITIAPSAPKPVRLAGVRLHDRPRAPWSDRFGWDG